MSAERMAVVERQIRNWELAVETQDRVDQQRAVQQIPDQVHPYISVSRDAGACCTEIVRAVSRDLGIEVLDKEILGYMAEKYNLSRGMLEHVDEATRNWLMDVFGKWINQRVVSQTQYVHRLGQVVLLAARSGSVMFVGRGAHFYLPREKGLLVWLTGPTEKRISRVMEEHGLDKEEATRYVDEKDRARRDFVLHYFHHDPSDPLLYDLVVNTEFVTPDHVADLLETHFRARFSA